MKDINLNIENINNMKYNNFNERNRYDLTEGNISQSIQSYQPSTTTNNNSFFASKIAKECFDINSIVKNSVEKINTLLSSNEITTKRKRYTHYKYANSIDDHRDKIFEKLNEEEDIKRIYVNKDTKKFNNNSICDIENKAKKTIDQSNINDIFKEITILNDPGKNGNKNKNNLCQSCCLNDTLFEDENDEILLNLESNKLYKNKNEKAKNIGNKTIATSHLKKTKKIKEASFINKYLKKPSDNITQINKKSSQIKTKKKAFYEKYLRECNNNKKIAKNYHCSITKELNSEKKDKNMKTIFGISNNNDLKKKIFCDKEILSKIKINKDIKDNKKSTSSKKRNPNNIKLFINSTAGQDYSALNKKNLPPDENQKNKPYIKSNENKEKIKVLDFLKMNFILTEYLINNNLFEDLNENKKIINEFSLFIANKIKNEDIKEKIQEDAIKKIQRIWRQKRIQNYTHNEDEELKKMVYNNFLMKSGYKIRKLLEIFHNLISTFKECHNNCDNIDKVFFELKKIINRDLTDNEKNILYKEYINSVIYVNK